MSSNRLDFSIQRWTAAVQGAFYLATGLWPLVHMTSFIAVTGPKTDLWLVRTVGILIAVIGTTLLSAFVRRSISLEIRILAVGSALSLAAVDIVYATAGRISAIYLLDAAAEFVLATAWMEGERRSRSKGK